MKSPRVEVLDADNSRYEVQAVSKAAAILSAFKTSIALTQSELALAVKLPKATVYRLATTLVQAGLLAKDSSDVYRLGSKIIVLARRVLDQGLPGIARPRMAELARRFGHSVNLGVRSGQDVLFIDVVESKQNFRTASVIGAREPLHATASGKAILAELSSNEIEEYVSVYGLKALTPNTITSRAALDRELEKIRSRGYAFDAGECVLGAHCVAAVVHVGSDVGGVISITATSGLLPIEDFDMVGESIKQLCNEISAEFGTAGSDGQLRSGARPGAG